MITAPTLLLDADRARRNIHRMAAKIQGTPVSLRPHFKTHQSQQVGRWFRDAGVQAITVSSMAMAEYFAADGWTDITLAVPVNLREIDRINRLARKIKLNLLVDSKAAVDKLADHLDQPTDIWIKIDVGYHRCGIMWYKTEQVVDLADQITNAEKLNFIGILTHAGHTYHQPGPEEVQRIHDEAVLRLIDLKKDLLDSGIESCAVSIGDTPGCSVSDKFPGVDEIRPGNFVFYDLMQLRLGVCNPQEVAVGVVCPVIGIYPKRGEIIVHCGAVHLSKEGLKLNNTTTVFGLLVPVTDEGWGIPDQSAAVISLSQEHGIVRLPAEMINKVELGSLVTILPVHSCLTANLFDKYQTLDGKMISKMQSK